MGKLNPILRTLTRCELDRERSRRKAPAQLREARDTLCDPCVVPERTGKKRADRRHLRR